MEDEGVHHPSDPADPERTMGDAEDVSPSSAGRSRSVRSWFCGWSQRKRVVAGLIVLTAILAGAVVVIGGPQESGRAAFYEALADLADAPGLRYRSPSDDALSLDVSITAEGRGTGTVGFGGFDFDLLVLGDESYVKPVLPDILRDRPEAEALDRWIAVEQGPFTPMLEGLQSPGELATALRRALDETGDVPSGDVTIGGTDALAADTPAGEIYVSRQAPHQVLRYVPDGADDGPSPPPLPSIEPPPSLPDLSLPPTTLGLRGASSHPLQTPDTTAPPSTEVPPGPSVPEVPGFPGPSLPEIPGMPPLAGSEMGLGEVDLAPISPEDLFDLLDDLDDSTRQLNNAVNPSIQLTLDGSAAVNCSAGGCTVTATVTGSVVPGADTRVISSQVTGQMTATLVIDGQSAPGCASGPVNLPNASGSLSCTSPGAGAVFSAAMARRQAQVRARGGGVAVVNYQAQAYVHALAVAQAQVTRHLQDIDAERERAIRADICGGRRQGLTGTRRQQGPPDPCRGTSSSPTPGGRVPGRPRQVARSDVMQVTAPAAVPARRHPVSQRDLDDFSRQRDGTIAGLFIDRKAVAPIRRSSGTDHAEQNLFDRGDADDALEEARRLAESGRPVTLDWVMNRTPCSSRTCGTTLEYLARQVSEMDGVRLRVIALGLYNARGGSGRTDPEWFVRMFDLGAEVHVLEPPGGTRTGGDWLWDAVRSGYELYASQYSG